MFNGKPQAKLQKKFNGQPQAKLQKKFNGQPQATLQKKFNGKPQANTPTAGCPTIAGATIGQAILSMTADRCTNSPYRRRAVQRRHQSLNQRAT